MGSSESTVSSRCQRSERRTSEAWHTSFVAPGEGAWLLTATELTRIPWSPAAPEFVPPLSGSRCGPALADMTGWSSHFCAYLNTSRLVLPHLFGITPSAQTLVCAIFVRTRAPAYFARCVRAGDEAASAIAAADAGTLPLCERGGMPWRAEGTGGLTKRRIPSAVTAAPSGSCRAIAGRYSALRGIHRCRRAEAFEPPTLQTAAVSGLFDQHDRARRARSVTYGLPSTGLPGGDRRRVICEAEQGNVFRAFARASVMVSPPPRARQAEAPAHPALNRLLLLRCCFMSGRGVCRHGGGRGASSSHVSSPAQRQSRGAIC